MDFNLFIFGSVIVLLMGLLAVGIKKQRGVMFAFIGGMVGIIFMAQLNTDGAIQGLGTGAPTGIFPWFYFPLMFTILDFSLALYEGTS